MFERLLSGIRWLQEPDEKAHRSIIWYAYMDRKKQIQLLGLNLGIATVDVIAFSYLESFWPSAFGKALGVTLIFLSGVGLIYGNYTLFSEPKIEPPAKIVITVDDYINEITNHKGLKPFEKTVEQLQDQIERLQKKNRLLREILLQKFSDSEISYKKFDGVISEVEKIFFMNIRSILNKMNAFDEKDYASFIDGKKKGEFSQQFIEEKLRVYDEYISFVRSATEYNEYILLKLDKLLLEISDLTIIKSDQLEQMAGMIEIDELIKQAKYYKN